MRRLVMCVCWVVVALSTAACSSERVMVLPRPPLDYEILGSAKGEATGTMWIFGSVYNFIPIGLNTRTEDAFDEALASVPGATHLINVSLSEDWYWFLLGSAKVITVRGQAIRERSR